MIFECIAMKAFELYWTTIHIGSLTEKNWDMRSSGDIHFHYKFREPENAGDILAAFIQHSILACEYLDNGDMDNYHKSCEEEYRFAGLINSPDWYLTDKDGQIVKILCPIFHPGHEVTWQRAA